MSDESVSQASKSVLSPHVAEFIPSALAKTLNQNAVKCSQNTTICQKPLRNLQETDKETQANNNKTCDSSKKVSTHDVKSEKPPILSWRQRDFEASVASKPPKYSQQFNLNTPERNWRYRCNEESVDNLKHLKPRSRNKDTPEDPSRNPIVDKTRRNISFQSSLRSNSDRYDGSFNQPRGEHKGFGRGRGKPRNAWINDYGSKENDFKALRSSGSDQGSMPGPGRGTVSYSDTLKGVRGSKTKNDFQGDTEHFSSDKDEQRQVIKKGHQQTAGGLNGESSASRMIGVDYKKNQNNVETNDDQNEVKLDDNSGKWARNSRKKLQNNKSVVNNEGEMKHKQENEWTKATKTKSQTERKNITEKHKAKAEEDNSEERISESSKLFENREVLEKRPRENNTPNDIVSDTKTRTEQKGTSQKNDNGNNFSLTDVSTKTKKIKLLSRKDEDVSAKSEAFDLLHNENEFPDLESTSTKFTETSLASDWLSGGNRMPIISYSAALKAIPKPQARKSNKPTTSESEKSMLAEGGEGGDSQLNKKKKKKKKKKNKDQNKPEQPPQQTAKKTKQPMQLDLGNWIAALDKSPAPKSKAEKQSSKKVTIATGVLQIKLQNALDTKSTVQTNFKPTAVVNKGSHNVLDSTAPLVKRGKEREIPKKKKPSQLKKIILKEREEKKKLLDGTPQEDDKTNENADDKSGIEEEPSCQTDQNQQEDTLTSVNADTVIKEASLAGVPTDEDVKAHIHSRRFREYCDNVMDKELNKTTTELLQKLVMFQDRQYHKDPIKSKAKRRYVVGLREVTKHLKLKKIKLVIISPNVERIKSAGGLDDTLHNIITIAHQNVVPVVFALRRQILGRILHKKVPVSAVGVFNYDGAQDHFKELMDLTEKARTVYAERWKKAYDEVMERIQREKELQFEQSEEQQDVEQQEQTIDPHEEIQENESSSDENEDNESEETTADTRSNYHVVHDKVENSASEDELDESACQKGNENSVEADIDIEDL